MNPSYKEIFNHTYQFGGVLTPDGTVRAVNDAILEFTGSERDEIIGKKLWEAPGIHFSETAQQHVHADVCKATDSEFVRHELYIQGAERTAIIDFLIQPLTDEHGDVTHLIAEGHDITALKQQDTVTSQTHHGGTHANLLVTYSRAADETMSEAIIQAFLALDVGIFETERTLQDWIDTDLIDGFDWRSDRPLTLTTRLWGYDVELTAGEVRIYTDPSPV